MAYQTKLAKIDIVGGVPVLTVDGEPIGPMTFQWALGPDSAWQLQNMGKAGVQLYFLRIALSDPEGIDDFLEELRAHVRTLREQVPDALAIIWFVFRPYAGFAKKYPGDVIVFNDGSTGGWLRPGMMGLRDENEPRHSFASRAWRGEVGGMLRRIVREVNETELGETIIGYFLFSLCYEWSWFWDYDASARCMDFSPAMRAAFRDYLAEKYAGDVRALRAAWGDAEVTFENAAIPGLEERQRTDYGAFWTPAHNARVYDYAECHAQVVADKLMYFSRVCKEESGGRAVVGSFWGYLQNQRTLWGGQARFKKLMDWPFLDFWAAPYTYENKGPGDFASMRYLVKSLQKHGKLYFAEADTFIHDSSESSHLHHGFPMTTYAQSRELLKRDFVYPLCESTQAWWLDWSSGKSQYEEDAFLPLMRRMQQIGADFFRMPEGGVSDVAAVVDQESLLCTTSAAIDCDPSNREVTEVARTPEAAARRFPSHLMYDAIDRFRVHELPRIGTPVDFYETDDALDGVGRKHKLYLFLNNYVMDEDERAKLAANLKRDGNVLVFMYGAGLLRPGAAVSADPENVEDVVGMRMGAEAREQSARMRLTEAAEKALPDLRAGMEIGEFERMITSGFRFAANDGVAFKPATSHVSPLLYVDDPDSLVLGRYVEGGRPGFAMKRFPEWTSVFIGSPCVQACVLRALAKLAGAHLFVDDRDVIVYANESFVALHTETAGAYRIRLKAPADVEEAFDRRKVAENAEAFDESIPEHTTRLYCLHPECLTR